MPIYEYACSDCRLVFSFLSKRINPESAPACPKCHGTNMTKQVTAFAYLSGNASGAELDDTADDPAGGPDLTDPKVARAMRDLERDMAGIDENNPRHMAHVLNKMKDIMPVDQMPKELNDAIRRMERGEDLDAIERSMGEELNAAVADYNDGGDASGDAGNYDQDPGLYDM